MLFPIDFLPDGIQRRDTVNICIYLKENFGFLLNFPNFTNDVR